MTGFWKSARRWLPGLLISLIAIAAILYFVDLQQFAGAIRSANYWLVSSAFVISVAWLAVRGMVWRTLLRDKATYRDTFLTISEGYLLNNIFPFRLGEIGRAFLLGRKSSLGFMEVLPTIIIERLLDLVIAATILLGAIPFVAGATGAVKFALFFGGTMLAGLFFLFMLVRNHNWAWNTFLNLTRRWPEFQKRGGSLLASVLTGLSILTNGALFIRVVLWMMFNWFISIFQYYLLILAFFPKATLLWSLFGLGAVSFGNAIPSLPGAVGTFEGSLSGAIILLGGNQSTALAAALTGHLFNYLTTGIIGLYALSREGETLMGIYRQVRMKQLSLRKTEAAPPPDSQNSLSNSNGLPQNVRGTKE